MHEYGQECTYRNVYIPWFYRIYPQAKVFGYLGMKHIKVLKYLGFDSYPQVYPQINLTDIF